MNHLGTTINLELQEEGVIEGGHGRAQPPSIILLLVIAWLMEAGTPCPPSTNNYKYM